MGRYGSLFPPSLSSRRESRGSATSSDATAFSRRYAQNWLGELSRSSPLSNIASQSQAFGSALVDTADQDRRRLESAVNARLQQTTVLPTEPAIVSQAYEAEILFGLSPQDAVVYMTVLDHAARSEGPKLFVTQNANDFRVPQIEEELTRHGCKLLVTFDAAEAYVRKEIGG
jgi:hypothetical protein